MDKATKKSNPLFASEEQIAEIFMGPGRTRDWKERIGVLEHEGLPKIDPLMGGRYLPAVKKFFDQRSDVIMRQRRPPPNEGESSCTPRPSSKRKLTPPTRQDSNGGTEPMDNVSTFGSPPKQR